MIYAVGIIFPILTAFTVGYFFGKNDVDPETAEGKLYYKNG